MLILDRWEKLRMMDNMTVASFMQVVYEVINNLLEVKQLP